MDDIRSEDGHPVLNGQMNQSDPAPKEGDPVHGMLGQTRDSRIAFILIHGVGDPANRELVNLSRGSFERVGVSFDAVDEFNWNMRVEHPFEPLLEDGKATLGWMNDIYLAHIGASVLNMALHPFSEGSSKYQRRLISGCERLALLYQTLPILVFAIPLCMALQAYGPLKYILAVYGTLLGISLLLSLATARLTTAFESIRSALVPAIWAIVYLMALPAAISLAATIGLVVFIALLVVIAHVPAYLQPVSTHFKGIVGTEAYNWKIYVYLVIGISAWGVLYTLCSRTIKTVLYPVLKIVADVVLYIGNAEYRTALVGELDALLESIGRTHTSVVLVSHSLGTVIAADALRQCPPDRFAEVTLITAGSPLARLFARFFPAAYPSPMSLYRYFHSKFPRFRWINVFRPLDPVGTSLGLPCGCDLSTGQRSRVLFGAHANYWNEPKAYELVVNRMKEPDAEVPKAEDEFHAKWAIGEEKTARFLRSASLAITILVVLASPILTILHHERAQAKGRGVLPKDNSEAPALIVHWRTYSELVERAQEEDFWQIRYTPHGASAPVEESLQDALDGSQSAISDFKPTSCWVDGHQAECMSARVRYANNDPSLFTLPDYDVEHRPGGTEEERWSWGWVLLVILLIPVVGLALFNLLGLLIGSVLFPPLCSLFGFIDNFSLRSNRSTKLRNERWASVLITRKRD